MKQQILILAIALFALTQAETAHESIRERLQQHSEACKGESGISADTLEKIKRREEVNDPKLKDHAFCVLKKGGVINSEGVLQVETIRSKLKEHNADSEAVEKFVTRCVVQKSTPQETSSEFFKCIAQLRKEHQAKN